MNGLGGAMSCESNDCPSKNKRPVLEMCALAKPAHPPAKIIENPFWEEIDDFAERVCRDGGFISLRVLMPKESYISEVNVKSVGGNFRLIAITRDSDSRRKLLEWWDPDRPMYTGRVRVGEDEWDARTVSKEPNVARSILRELYDFGRLSCGTMKNMRSQWDPKPIE